MVPRLLQPHAMQAATPCDASLQPHVPQAFIFEAMLLSTPQTRSSFGVPTPFTHAMQRLHVLHPRLLLLPASVAAVRFETLTLTLFNPDPHPHPHPNPDPDPHQELSLTLSLTLSRSSPGSARVGGLAWLGLGSGSGSGLG